MPYWGIDSCKAGWIAIGLDNETFQAKVFPNIRSFWEETATKIENLLIDIPIGLSSSDERKQVELAARKILKIRSSSVFAVPCRQAIEYAQSQNFAPSAYPQAVTLNREITGQAFSKQSWNIIPKIADVNIFLRKEQNARALFAESHPELLFSILAGKPLFYPKKSGLGFMERLAILQIYRPDALDIIQKTKRDNKSRVGDDDIVDALVCAICASMPKLATLPENPQQDDYGLPMRMIYPVLN